MSTATRFRRPTTNYRYNLTELTLAGRKVHVTIERIKRSRYALTVIEYGATTYYGSLKAARMAVEEMRNGSLELVLS